MYLNFLPVKSIVTVGALALVLFSCNDGEKTEATGPVDPKVERLKLQPGFTAERLFGPSENEDGSWVSMTFDDKGRIIASDQYGALYRLVVPPVGDTTKTTIEKLSIPNDNTLVGDTSKKKVGIGFAHGLLYAFNSLYVMVNSLNDEATTRTSGLYRLQDTDGDDQFDKVTLLKALKGEGEHGPHSLILSPDKKSIYVVIGNHTDIPQLDAYQLPSNWKEDNLFPLITDPNGHAVDRKAPGGWIARVDPESNKWELISAGYRNPFDIAFNAAGDLFTYDSDMEWDFGTPWYRPTRICHVTGGSEYGWRTGNSKWSPSYPDNLPPVLNIGQGSPTNLMYSGNARFPEKYKNTLFAFDWSFGIIYAVHLEADGASYKAKGEEFLSGSPLPLTDGEIGPDGAMYFLTGGRRLESDLYRVYYKDNKEKTTDELLGTPEETPESKLRRQLEAYHGAPQTGAVDFAWPQLKNSDRFVRYAARIAVEHQPVSQWQQRALDEKDPVTATQALIALARQGNAGVKNQILNALTAIDFAKLSEPQQIDIARAFELVFSRMGQPDAATKEKVIAYLDPQYPAKTNELNRVLSKVLVYIDAPKAVEKTMELMASAKDEDTQKTFTSSSDLIMRNPQYGMDIANMLSKVPPQQQTYYANVLSRAKSGWTPELREKYFQWFYTAFSYKGGHSFRGFINKARTNALENVSKAQFAHFNTISGDSIVNRSGNALADAAVQPKGPGRRWKMEDALPVIDSGLVNRDFEQGKAMFAASLCISCHTMKGEGGVSGPDLTQLGTRFSAKDILEAIIDPSKTISDQYGATVFYLKDGGSVVGRLIKEEGDNYVISQNPFAPQIVREIPKKDVARTRVSEVSPMLPGMINRLNNEELKDLIAYLVAGGNKDHEVYTGKK